MAERYSRSRPSRKRIQTKHRLAHRGSRTWKRKTDAGSAGSPAAQAARIRPEQVISSADRNTMPRMEGSQ